MDTPTSLMNERLNTLCDGVGSLAKEIAKIRECMGSLRADVAWLKKGFWLLACTVVTTLATALAASLFG